MPKRLLHQTGISVGETVLFRLSVTNAPTSFILKLHSYLELASNLDINYFRTVLIKIKVTIQISTKPTSCHEQIIQ